LIEQTKGKELTKKEIEKAFMESIAAYGASLNKSNA
jgi:hypothetical protein